jgi:hypothetical protein
MTTALADVSFDQLTEMIDQLSLDEQEALLQVLKQRITMSHRQQIIDDVRESEAELASGKIRIMSPEEIMKDVLS